MMALGVDGKAPFAQTQTTIRTGGGDAAAELAALHADGQKIIDFSAKVSALEARAANVVADPAIASAFGDSAKTYDYMGSLVGAMARDAVSTDASFSAMIAAAFDPKTVAATAAGEAANETITTYVEAKCGIDLGGKEPSASPTTNPTTGTSVLGG